MLKGKTFIEFTNLFSPDNFKKNGDIVLKDFMKNVQNNILKYKMESYCLKCKKNTENIDPKDSAKSIGTAMILSKCAICGSKKSRFIKNQEAKRLLSNLVLENHSVKYQYWVIFCLKWV